MTDVLDNLELRYGEGVGSPELDRLQLKQRRSELRARAIRAQIRELSEELTRLDGEQQRMEALRLLLIDDLADQIRRRHNEAWSPTPITGYRVWGISQTGDMIGATGHRWATPTVTAECVRSRADDDLPHTDVRCSAVGYGCGVYAAKNHNLLESLPAYSAWAIGVVALTGKVVEHERGYRAATAAVTSIVATTPDHHLATSEPDLLERLFQHPLQTLATEGSMGPDLHPSRSLDQLSSELERNSEPWT